MYNYCKADGCPELNTSVCCCACNSSDKEVCKFVCDTANAIDNGEISDCKLGY